MSEGLAHNLLNSNAEYSIGVSSSEIMQPCPSTRREAAFTPNE